MKIRTTKLRVHVACNTTLSVGALVTLAMHAVSPLAEAVSFFVTSVGAVWASDVERVFRHVRILGLEVIAESENLEKEGVEHA